MSIKRETREWNEVIRELPVNDLSTSQTSFGPGLGRELHTWNEVIRELPVNSLTATIPVSGPVSESGQVHSTEPQTNQQQNQEGYNSNLKRTACGYHMSLPRPTLKEPFDIDTLKRIVENGSLLIQQALKQLLETYSQELQAVRTELHSIKVTQPLIKEVVEELKTENQRLKEKAEIRERIIEVLSKSVRPLDRSVEATNQYIKTLENTVMYASIEKDALRKLYSVEYYLRALERGHHVKYSDAWAQAIDIIEKAKDKVEKSRNLNYVELLNKYKHLYTRQ